MRQRARATGFTLIEVLVALALVASALGGTLAVVRQAIDTQGYLERRLFAHWVADNVLSQVTLDMANRAEVTREGRETMLGRRYSYRVSVTPLAPPADDPGDFFAARDDDAADNPGLATGDSAPAYDEVVVEVRDSPRAPAPLAVATRLLRRATGVP